MKRNLLNMKAAGFFLAAVIMLSFSRDVLGENLYRVKRVDAPTGVEWRCFKGGHHFLSVLSLPGGAVAVRPHPGADANGWGVTEYLNIMLSSGQPRRGTIISVRATDKQIIVKSRGRVAAGGNSWYGDWSSTLRFKYNGSRITGSGVIDVTLFDALEEAGADLVLGRMASNYLVGVPRQGARVGDTGDMRKAKVSYGKFSTPWDFSWFPPDQPAHYPQDESKYISIQNVGRINDVDTLALGEDFQIAVARKPSLKWTLISDEPMIVGLAYDVFKSQDFAADNVAMSHLILQGGAPKTDFHFGVRMVSTP